MPKAKQKLQMVHYTPEEDKLILNHMENNVPAEVTAKQLTKLGTKRDIAGVYYRRSILNKLNRPPIVNPKVTKEAIAEQEIAISLNGLPLKSVLGITDFLRSQKVSFDIRS